MYRHKMKLKKLCLCLVQFLVFFLFLPSPTIRKKTQRDVVIVVMLLEKSAFVKLCDRDMQYLKKHSPYGSWVSDVHWWLWSIGHLQWHNFTKSETIDWKSSDAEGVSGLPAEYEPQLVLCFVFMLVVSEEHPSVGYTTLTSPPPGLGKPTRRYE